MKLVPFLLISLLGQITVAQNNMKPVVSAQYAMIVGDSDFFVGELQIGCGVQFNDYFSLQLTLRGIQNARDVSNHVIKDPLRIVTLSLSPYYRILKRKYFASPVIGIDVGTQIWSNGFGRYIDRNWSFINKPEHSYDGFLFNKGVFFGKAKLLVDFKIWNFNILVGPSFNMYYFKLDNNIWDVKGLGLEGTVTYTFPMKKRAAKATSGE